ncbi:MAG: response regulator [Hymenobacteraceae bacterium]|nr:response regulator [Hymenobacteraceae bacterium]
MPHIPDIATEPVQQLRILIIDDDTVDQMAIQRSLRKTPLQAFVTTAATATEGLRLLDTERFDCIFTDFMLPDMNGLELLERIKRKGVEAPILVVTSQGDERIAASAIRLGAADYLPKSLLNPEGIYHSIRNAIRLQQAEQQRLQTERRLQTAQLQLEMLISNSPMAFWNVDAQGVIQYAKGMAYETVGIVPEKLIGQNIRDAFRRLPRVMERFERAFSGETVQSVDESSGRYFKAYYSPVYDEAQKVTGVTGFAIDITERIQNERELLQAKEIAEKSVRVKEQFLANISHEIRTPMNGILGLTNVMKKTELDQEQHKYLRAIHTSANNLMQIINDLLDFSKISAQQFTFEQVEFDLQELIQEIVDLMEVKIRERQNTLSTYLDHKVPTRLTGDPLRLRQVLLNLISNAAKFTENGTIKLLVHCIGEKPGEVVLEFTVEDTGIGIPEEKLHVIFESFNQASNDTTRKYGGTGLGLTISRNLVEMQGGTIAVRSQPLVGSAFTFSLPFGIEEAQGQALLQDPLVLEGALEDLSNLNVLLAEDNEINQLLINTVLGGWGVRVDAVADGLQALESFRNKAYDIILMDMQMPEMDGYEAIRQIRSSGEGNAQIPVIALTAHATAGEIERCLAAGANAYVSKPFEPEELHRIMYELTNSSRHQPAAAGPSFNMEAIRAIAGGNTAFVSEVISMYSVSIPEAIQKIGHQAAAGSTEELKVSLSELYDSLAIISAQPLQGTVEQMQQALEKQEMQKLQELAQFAEAASAALSRLLQEEQHKLQ